MLYDLLIIGGGINGTAIAREAARNGLSVLLVEKDDLASHTSSASTKLIHGGLRYLEYYEFGLVREALKERERLLHAAPHIIRPMHFVLPHQNAVRPWWLVRLGLLLYDWIGGIISLDRSRSLKKSDTLYQAPLKSPGKGFVYSDAWVDDARLVVLNARDAADHGATILTRTALNAARRDGKSWRAELSGGQVITARAIVNAAGPWVSTLFERLGESAAHRTRLVKGSHIIVPRLFEGDHAYMLQQPDKRIIFAIPFQRDKTLIGTTDVPVETPEDAQISVEETRYLCDAANRYFLREIAPEDIVATYSGIRPLYDDGENDAKAVTRDYVLAMDPRDMPLMSVFGGKITTARHLAEEAVELLAAALSHDFEPTTRAAFLPGGDLGGPIDAFVATTQRRWPFLGARRARRMVQAYGCELNSMLEQVQTADDLGTDFGAGLTECEVKWLIDKEWARSADDILWRRTKLGLTYTSAQAAALSAYVTRLVSG